MASALAFFIAPVIFALNLYFCLRVIPKKDKQFYPLPVCEIVRLGEFCNLYRHDGDSFLRQSVEDPTVGE